MSLTNMKIKKSHAKVRVGLPRKKPGLFKPVCIIPKALAAPDGDADAGEEGTREWDAKGSVIRNYRTFGVVSNPNIRSAVSLSHQIAECPALQLPDRESAPVSEFDSIDSGSDLESDGEATECSRGECSRDLVFVAGKRSACFSLIRRRILLFLEMFSGLCRFMLHIVRANYSFTEINSFPDNFIAFPLFTFDLISNNAELKSALGKMRRDGKVAPTQPLTFMQRVHVGKLIEKYGDDYQAMFRDTTLNRMQHSVASLKKLCQRYYSRGKLFLLFLHVWN
ncbi:hypothetical protein ZIOFF_067763 [Zingiber officinale]|uniref:Nucleolar protein 16 n=1 Tax=Zingiber officinale TaxID=94328 RepID=A0A8J5C651_ZINOF|nr:hypothetical protein ZIOFF_067763 [Zingiber officinale]